MRGGCIYTAEPINHKWTEGRLKGFRYRGYCDGQPCGFFETKAAFEAFVACQPEFTAICHNTDAYVAQSMSEWDGLEILAKLCNRPLASQARCLGR
jgi:hypothetical protein